MAAYYVDNATGDDARTGTQAQNPATPWKTIQKAVDTAPSGSTIEVFPGTYTETAFGYLYFYQPSRTFVIQPYTGGATGDVILAPGTYGINFHSAAAGSDITLRSLPPWTFKIRSGNFGGDGARLLTISNANDITVLLEAMDLAWDDPVHTGTLVMAQATSSAPTRTLTISGGRFVHRNGAVGSGLQIEDVADFSVVGAEVVGSGAQAAVDLRGRVTQAVIEACSLANPGSEGIATHRGTVLTECDRLRIEGNTINSGAALICQEYVALLELLENTIQSTDGKGFQIGLDSGTVSNPLGLVVCTKNTIAIDGATPAHGLLIGMGADGGLYRGNAISGGNWQIVVKGSRNHITHNTAYGQRGLHIYGGDRNYAAFNSVYATAGDGTGWDAAFLLGQQAGVDATRNIVVDNIFDASGGARYAISDYNQSGAGGNYVDGNCYRGGTYRGRLGGVDLADLAAIRTKWATYGAGSFPANDAASLEDDPQMVAPASGDFGIRFASACRGRSMVSFADLGARQRRELAPAGPVNRRMQS